MAKSPETNVRYRNPTSSGKEALAQLMIDAYRDTIDYDGETISEAMAEVDAFFAGDQGRPMPRHSWLCIRDHQFASACLVGWWQAQDGPLIAYIMTQARWKRRGLATAVLRASLAALANDGYHGVYAVITEGNSASEKLFQRAGFQKRNE